MYILWHSKISFLFLSNRNLGLIITTQATPGNLAIVIVISYMLRRNKRQRCTLPLANITLFAPKYYYIIIWLLLFLRIGRGQFIQIFLSILFSFLPFFADRCETTPARVSHCTGRVRNYFSFHLAQTRAHHVEPWGRGKDDVSEQRPRMPEILIIFARINNVIGIFAHNNIVDITWLTLVLIKHAYTQLHCYRLYDWILLLYYIHFILEHTKSYY